MYVERCRGRQAFLHSTSRLLFFWLSDREILNRGKFSMSGNKGVCVHKALVRGCDNVSQIKLVLIFIILFKISHMGLDPVTVPPLSPRKCIICILFQSSTSSRYYISSLYKSLCTSGFFFAIRKIFSPTPSTSQLN